MTFKQKLIQTLEQPDLSVCLRHPIQFLSFSRVCLKKETADWKYEPHTGISFTVSLFTYGAVFTMPVFLVIFFTLAILWGVEVAGSYEYQILMLATLPGYFFGFVLTIQKELEKVSKTLSLLRFSKKAEKWKKNGAVDGLKEMCGLEYPDHNYFQEN